MGAADDLLDQAWATLVDRPGPLRAPVTAGGAGGALPSHHRVEDVAVASIGVALLAAAALVDGAPAVGLDRDHAAVAVVSERHVRLGDRPTGMGFAPLSRFWAAADGWVRTHANYPWHRSALLAALGAADDPEAVGAAIAALAATEVEERVFAAGGIAAAVRTGDAWRAHPQGLAVAAEPLIGHEVVGAALARAPRLAGTRVLDLTRVIAGPVCTRFLGALGADVLRLDPPGHADLTPGDRGDTLAAKRSAGLDLAAGGALDVLHGLLDGADVLVCGYRPRSLDRFGLDDETLARRHPGLVVVRLAAWGHSGPWSGRRGFDSVVQGPTGLALAESVDGGATPGALPCQLLDHATGYLAAAAALDGLRRQSAGGGTVVRRLSLARTAAWLSSTFDPAPPPQAVAPDPAPWLEAHGAGDDAVTLVAPPGSLGRRRLRWPAAPARYLSDTAAWTT